MTILHYVKFSLSSDLKKHLYVDQYCRDQPMLLNYLMENSLIDVGMQLPLLKKMNFYQFLAVFSVPLFLKHLE